MDERRIRREVPEETETTPGSSTTQGQKYEYLMLALIYLRSLRNSSHFRLGRNLAGLGQFDDIFLDLHWKDEEGNEKNEIFCMQLKHKERGGFIHLDQLTGECGKFSILKYYKSYCDIEDASKGLAQTKNKHILGNINFDNITFVLYTNSCCQHSCEDLSGLKVGERIINTGTEEGCIFSFGPEHSEVWNLRNNYNDRGRFHKFLSKLRMCNNQIHVDQLPELIQKEIIQVAGVRWHDSGPLTQKFIDSMQEWWSKKPVLLSENSDLWYEALMEDMNRKITTVLHKSGYRFKPECSDFLIERVSRGVCLNIVVPDIHRKLRCLKIFSPLESKFKGRYLLMESNEVTRRKDHIIALCQRGFCDVLVIDVQIFPGFQQLISGVRTDLITTILVSGRALENTGTIYQDSWCIDQFYEESQMRLLKTDVELQGEEVPLIELCNGEMISSLTSKMIGALVRGNKVTFGTTPLDDVDLYIPRTFRHQTILQEEILCEIHEHDLFCISEYPLESQERSSFIPSDNQDESQSIHILSYESKVTMSHGTFYSAEHPDTVAFHQLCSKNIGIKNVHWLVYHDGLLFWKETFGNNEVICKYIKKFSKKCKEGVDCCHSAEFLDDWTERLRLVIGEPGVGKSTLLKQIACVTKEKNPGSWVVIVELINFTNYFQNMSVNDVTLEHIVKLLAEAAELNKSTCPELATKLIVDSLVNRGNIVVLLDAVDEIAPLHSEEVITIIHFLLETKSSEIWTSSRSVLQAQLQKQLSVIPFLLEPFTEEEMQDFFKRYFNNVTNTYNLYDMVIKLTDNIKMKETASSISRNICAIPLHAKMTADIVKEMAEVSSETLVKLNLNRLYEYFLNMKLALYYKKFGIDMLKAAITTITARETQQFIDNHIICALYVTFEPVERKLLGIQGVEAAVTSFLQRIEYEKTGLIDGVFDGKPKFIHFTICEYLVARWFKDLYEQSHNLDRLRANNGLLVLISSNVAQKLLDLFTLNKRKNHIRNKYEKLLESKLNVVRLFFDQMLANGFAVHEAVLNGDADKVEKALNSGLSVNSIDRGGRLPLHLAAAHNHTDIVCLLLGVESLVNVRDKVLGWTPLRYADRVEAWSVADVLLQYGAHSRDMPVFKRLVKSQGASKTFMSAVVSGHLDLMRLMLREWGMQTISHSYKLSALITAATKGNRAAVHLLMCNNTDINGFDRYGYTPLTYAVEGRATKCVTLLVDLGADINGRNKFGNTPLISAILSQNLEMMEHLLKLGADINYPDESGCTPLYIAVQHQYKDESAYLLRMGADVNHRSKDGNTALLKAMQNKDQVTMKKLLELKADVNCLDKYGETPVLKCMHNNDHETLQLLLQHGANLNYDQTDGDTLLSKAIKRKDKRMIILLLEYGADPNCASSDGYTPLNHAVYARDKELMQLLINYKADIDIPINRGWSLLHKAILNKERETMKWLLDFGANVNLVEQDGETPLLRALEHQDRETIKILLERQADVNKANRDGETPLHKAVLFMNMEIVKLLLQFGANPNAQDKEGCTPLHIAMNNWNPEIQKLLLQYGADIKIKNKYEKSPLSIALGRQSSECPITLSFNPPLASAKFNLDVYSQVYGNVPT